MIHKIEAYNYKGLRYVSQTVNPFQILVGPNGSGKSTFLDVVSIISDFIRNGAYSALILNGGKGKGRAGRIEELFFDQSSDHFELAVELLIPEHLNSDYKIARYEVSFGKTEEGTLKIIAENLLLSNYISRQNLSKQKNFPSPPGNINTIIDKPGNGENIIASFRSGNYFYTAEKKALTSQPHIIGQLSFKADADKSVFSNIVQDTETFPVALWAKEILANGVQVLSLNSTAMRRAVSPSVSRKFKADGSNLPHVINDFEKNNPQDYKDWLVHVRTIIPDIEGIKVIERDDDRHSYLAIKYSDLQHPVPSWLISDGTLRMLALTLIAYLPDKDNIYLIEEPENGVHPKVLEGVFQSLTSVYDNQVFVATHSPIFLGLATIPDLLCFAKNPSGAVSIINGEDHPKLRQWKGETALSTLFAGGVLG